MQWVMPAKARTARVVDGFVGNRFVRIAPTPLLAEELCQRPRVDAARVADVHDVAPRLGQLCRDETPRELDKSPDVRWKDSVPSFTRFLSALVSDLVFRPINDQV